MLARMVPYIIKYAIPSRQFYLLAFRRQDARSKIERLNTRRQQIQRSILEICSHTDVCQKCGGFCCNGDYNHFTLIDYLIRMFSDNPIPDYGVCLQKLRPIHLIIWGKITRFLFGIDEFDKIRQSHQIVQKHCPDLASNGCRFLPEDRPIRCVMWTCPAFRKSLSDEDFHKFNQLTKELCSISKKVLRLL
jgi:hypothetical protein